MRAPPSQRLAAAAPRARSIEITRERVKGRRHRHAEVDEAVVAGDDERGVLQDAAALGGLDHRADGAIGGGERAQLVVRAAVIQRTSAAHDELLDRHFRALAQHSDGVSASHRSASIEPRTTPGVAHLARSTRAIRWVVPKGKPYPYH